MTDHSLQEDLQDSVLLDDDLEETELSDEEVEAELLQRRIARLIAPEHVEEFAVMVRSLPPAEALRGYRAFFSPMDERESLLLVRVSLRKLTHQALLNAVPRIITARPDIAGLLAQCWLAINRDVMEAMLDNLPLPADVSTDVLATARFVLEEELPQGEDTRALTAALNRAAQLQAEVASWREKHAAAEVETARLSRELTHLQEKLRRAEERTEAAVEQEREQATRRSEREQRRAQQALEASEKEVERLQQRYEQEIAANRVTTKQLEKAVEQLELKVRADDSERSQRLSTLLARERAESERMRSRHAHQLTEMHARITGLENQLAAQSDPSELAFDKALLDDALVISYASIDPDPIQRLIALFELYAAFLEGQHEHGLLVRHSNISQFRDRPPSGILLLGLEQLLLDGVNVPLTRYLKMRGFKQETVLHQLISRLHSPRLQGESR